MNKIFEATSYFLGATLHVIFVIAFLVWSIKWVYAFLRRKKHIHKLEFVARGRWGRVYECSKCPKLKYIGAPRTTIKASGPQPPSNKKMVAGRMRNIPPSPSMDE